MVILITIVHVIVCVFLAVVVLLQSGKAADLAGAFGGMGSQTAFGPRGSATLLSKATTISAVLFMVTSLVAAGLGFLGIGVRPPTPEWGGLIASGTRSQVCPAAWRVAAQTPPDDADLATGGGIYLGKPVAQRATHA